jgi:preprotein translocase subunit SecA
MARSTLLPIASARRLRRDAACIRRIRQRVDELRGESTAQLAGRASDLRGMARNSKPVASSELIEPAFALMCEAVRRGLGFELYDVQLKAGLAMAAGAVAEMQTGEGKTLSASLPAYWFSLFGKGVHIATPNAYLAERDARSLEAAFSLLGCTVGVLPERAAPELKRAAYACDITYATGYELGFDYLRDRLQGLSEGSLALGERHRRLLRGDTVEAPRLQRGQSFAIVDEIDSVLIDEACTPLILAEASPELADDYQAHGHARRIAAELAAGRDYQIDWQTRQVSFKKGVGSLCLPAGGVPLFRPWADYVRQALFAEHLLARDVDYVVADGRVLLVDEFTGRIHQDRSWQDGLQQAVEAKEGLTLRAPQRTLARITRQRFFRQYQTICGMTGTAFTSRREFWRQYRLPVVPIPLAHPCRRVELPDRFFTTAETKLAAIVREVHSRHARGQPVLVGSRTIENSLRLAQLLSDTAIPFCLLNGRQDQAEAEIIARAGQPGAVTIATNMAGRGTDIRLAAGVAEDGGLHLIGMERHESQRIDRQLIGRVARQGDPGSCQFFLSAEDTLLRRFAPRRSQRMSCLPQHDGEILRDLSGDVRRAQRQAEALACHARRRLVLYDDWLVDR